MSVMEKFLKAIEYKISGGSEFTWECFGPFARYLDCSDSEGSDGTFSVSAIFDSEDQTVYCIEAWDYINDREYRWVNPEFKEAYKNEAHDRDVSANESIDNREFIELDVLDDILEKTNALVNNVAYDERVRIEVDFSDEDLLKYMKAAHERDMTFNEFIADALQELIDEYKANPELAIARAKKFKERLYEDQGSV